MTAADVRTSFAQPPAQGGRAGRARDSQVSAARESSAPSIRVDEADITTRALLTRAEQQFAQRQWDEAVAAWERAMDGDGDRLVPIVDRHPRQVDVADDSPSLAIVHYVTVRHRAQQWLAALQRAHPPSLAAFRRRIDVLAEPAYQAAIEQGDFERLEQIVDQWFLSSVADDALLRLGDEALREGRYVAARRAWERIHPELRNFGETPAAAGEKRTPPERREPLAQPLRTSRSSELGESWWWSVGAREVAARESTGPAPTARRAINGRRLPSPDQGPADAEQESPPSGARLADRVDVLANATGQSRGGAASQSRRRSLPLVPDTQPLDVTARTSEIRRVTAEEPADAVVAAGPLGSWLYYPDSDIPIADVAARLVLVSIQEGDLARAEWELARFRSRHGEAPGELAGRREPWVKLLDDWLKAARTWSTPTVGRDWTTWGGAASRGRAAERDVDPAGKPRWTVELPRLTAPPDLDGRAARRVGESAAGLLSYHPVVVAGKVLLQTSDGMSAWELATGRPAFPPLADSPGTPGLWFATNELAEWLKLDSGRVGGVPRFTLSASSDGVVWGKAGAPWAPGFEARKRPKPAAIVAFDLSAEGKVVLRLDGTGDEADESWAWEGPPIVADGRLFVALRKGDTLETESHVACFDATTGRLRWRRFLAAAENAKQRRVVEWTHDLLALSEDSLYVQTHAGVVASLDVRDGRLNWLTAYPRSTLDDDAPAQQRDLAPCLVERDLVVVAPRDSERLHALDAVSGRQVWMNDGPQASDATQLLGVGAGRLVTGGDALQWFDLATGRWQCRFPPAGTRATGTVRDAPRGHGRGLLAGPRVWWPTHDKLYVFEQQTQRTGQGWQPRAVREIEMTRRGATGGNLLIVDGMLLIAGVDKLYAFAESASAP